MVKTSESFFERTLHQKISEAKTAIETCITEFLSSDTGNREASANAALEAIDRIFQLLHSSDRPQWLNDLHRDLRFAATQSTNKNGIIAMQRIISTLYPKMLNHNWKSNFAGEIPGFNFDAVFRKYRSEYRIPELFDELIKYLNEIISSEEIDSLKVIKELQKIISTLQISKSGSYFATNGAWYFIATWFKNTGWELLSEVPIAGSVFKGLRKTLEDTDTNMNKMHASIQEDIRTELSVDFLWLEYVPPEIPQIEEYNENEIEEK